MSTVDCTTENRSTKNNGRSLLSQLPGDCTIEDVQHGLSVLEKIRCGKEEIDRRQGISHEEVERQVEQWFTK